MSERLNVLTSELVQELAAMAPGAREKATISVLGVLTMGYTNKSLKKVFRFIIENRQKLINLARSSANADKKIAERQEVKNEDKQA